MDPLVIKTREIKVRKSWGSISPVTKIKQSKKAYSRSAYKNALKKEIYA